MRARCVISIVVAAVVASCNATSSLVSLEQHNSIQTLPTSVNNNTSKRLLRAAEANLEDSDGDEERTMPKISSKMIKGVLKDPSYRDEIFRFWKWERLTLNELTESLRISTYKNKWIRGILNLNKQEQLRVLRLYRDSLGH
ncbi:unnamed protein product [Phytophthora fragariaefolia]|uniref:RxLR effector protein n=1 Tax=Phytophthora fragariaefolia TaxID=1490495 RepID=A0A9W6XQG0_9STRA|nr:unnamed protein product [Phytophthora fragariaefolia]